MSSKPGAKSRFSQADLDKIRAFLAQGMPQGEIAKYFGCSQPTISRVIAKMDGGEPIPVKPLTGLEKLIEQADRERHLFDAIQHAYNTGNQARYNELTAEVERIRNER